MLHRERSAFQDILILDTPALGKVLALDGIVQCAQKDEAIYHELLAHSGVLLRQTVAPTEGGSTCWWWAAAMAALPASASSMPAWIG